MRGVRKVGHPGPTLSTHQRVITSTMFKETDGRILISFCVWKANMIVLKQGTMTCLVYVYIRGVVTYNIGSNYFKKSRVYLKRSFQSHIF